jgi:hypothetical protein
VCLRVSAPFAAPVLGLYAHTVVVLLTVLPLWRRLRVIHPPIPSAAVSTTPAANADGLGVGVAVALNKGACRGVLAVLLEGSRRRL